MQRITLQGQVQDGTHNTTNNTQWDGADSGIAEWEKDTKKELETTAGEELTDVACI